MRLLALPVLFVAVGCGSDGTKKPMLLDAKVYLDAGVDAEPGCGVKPNLGGLALGDAQAPAGSMAPGADWYEVFPATALALAGKSYFDLGAGLPPNISGDAIGDTLVVRYIKPQGGYLLNTAIPLNPDPAETVPVAYAFLYTDVTAANEYNKFYFASSGTLTLTASNENDGGITTGMVSGVNFREVDPDTNADVPGGCTTKVAVSFTLKQTEIPDMPFQKNARQLDDRMLAAPQAQLEAAE